MSTLDGRWRTLWFFSYSRQFPNYSPYIFTSCPFPSPCLLHFFFPDNSPHPETPLFSCPLPPDFSMFQSSSPRPSIHEAQSPTLCTFLSWNNLQRLWSSESKSLATKHKFLFPEQGGLLIRHSLGVGRGGAFAFLPGVGMWWEGRESRESSPLSWKGFNHPSNAERQRQTENR